jgi:glutaredoxin
MKNLEVVVFTMKGCPFCVDFKKMLEENNIEFHDRDIDEYKDEYDLFSEITSNDMIPALLVIEGNEKNHKSFMYVPDKDYDDLSEAVDLINNHRKNVGII